MKKKILCLALIVVMLFTVLASCGHKAPTIIKPDENTVVIDVTNSKDFPVDGKSLEDYMNYLASEKVLTFTIDKGMVTVINDKAQDDKNSSYWMLYTSDADNANEEWGVMEYEGKKYGSATLGATDLKVKDGCRYIWSYQTLSW